MTFWRICSTVVLTPLSPRNFAKNSLKLTKPFSGHYLHVDHYAVFCSWWLIRASEVLGSITSHPREMRGGGTRPRPEEVVEIEPNEVQACTEGKMCCLFGKINSLFREGTRHDPSEPQELSLPKFGTCTEGKMYCLFCKIQYYFQGTLTFP